MKEYSYKEFISKYLTSDWEMGISLRIINGDSIIKIAADSVISVENIENIFKKTIRNLYTLYADGPSADGKLSIEEIIKYLKNG